ncbi:hypothetical protein ES677_14495 [Bizionia gelidisalsuginis]|uniref:DUF6705 domain-containing protein n=2 Tax=Bizionia TaxID=283785 RepID=A0ABY3M709_9FLAO|nr:DUF6705 family protein [Bizionia gelidisalsuginis]TYC08414.1 hypothetical protein ES677_14495 [Bizionia gelidisalsuginis]
MKLKFLYTFLICLGLTTTIKAQETIKSLKTGLPGEIGEGPVYYKDIENTLDKYLETWLYEDGTTYFKITFIKKEHTPLTGGVKVDYRDMIAGEYLLKINGITKYDTYGANNSSNDSMANYISGGLIVSENKLEILFYTEPPLNGLCERYASGKLLLEYTPIFGSADELIWTRTNNQLYGDTTECNDGTQMDTSEFLIPETMVLVKQ